ncbi:hypothetical protein [Halalkalibacter lacteus]|uniref:hypothetical protein n=1 Tax=Halalkalibacter lacteus TaxID=3090663 RepID=UPI002FC73D0D
MMSAEKAFYYLAKHVLNVMQYKDLALADVDVPIVIIAPDEIYLDDNELALLQEASNDNVLSHFEHLFDLNFSSQENVERFLGGIETNEQLIGALKRPERLLFDSDWKEEPLTVQLEKWKTEQLGPLASDLKKRSLGNMLKMQVTGRMMQMNEVAIRSLQFILKKFDQNYQICCSIIGPFSGIRPYCTLIDDQLKKGLHNYL